MMKAGERPWVIQASCWTHGDVIQGFLFSSGELADHWAMLDAFEGEAYVRVSTEVMLDENRTVEAYIYTLRAN
jgi:gamma-glutamylcyclotransferase (GGCT)/AIG2-like uncharacterized protein YtfP